MFSVELTFKIEGREVGLDSFAEAIVARALESVRKDIQTLRVAPETVVMPAVVGAREKTQRKAVSVDRAAELLSLSSQTIRNYIGQHRLRSIRVGRRVLIPMDTVEKVLRKGVPPLRR